MAGQGNAESELAEIQQQLQPHFELEVYQTTQDIRAIVLAQRAIAAGVDLVIASGGDGTISEVAGALLRTQIPLGIISRGTANAFANALEIPTDIAGACDVLINGYAGQVDAGQVDVGDCNGHPLLLLAGIGFEAETVEGADRQSKDRFGTFAYLISALNQLQNLNPFEVELETEERIISCSATAITVANAAPPTSILAQGPAAVLWNDGLLDITIFAPETVLSAMAASYHLLQSALQNAAAERQDIGYFKVKSLTIRTDPVQKVVVDGEVMGTTPVQIQCMPAGLTLMLPHQASEAVSEDLAGLPNLEIEHKR